MPNAVTNAVRNAVPNVLHNVVGAPKSIHKLTAVPNAVRNTECNTERNTERHTVRNTVGHTVIRWLTILTFIIFASFAISLLTVGHRCYYDSDKTWVNDAQVCLRVIITGIVMMFIVCVIIVIDGLIWIIRYLDS
jgi:hypothetical protein